MKIEHFERNDAGQIVAIEGSEKLVLPFSFVAESKPTVGDYVFQTEEGMFFGPQVPEVQEIEPVIEPELTPIEVAAEAPIEI